MTDEERAREIVASVEGISDLQRERLMTGVLLGFWDIRADERENCAQVAHIIEETARAVIQIPWSYHAACGDVAAAIRAMGDKG